MSVSIAGSRLLPAECDRVWAALQDVESLSLCVPGCETLARLSPSIYALSVVVPIGPVRVSVGGTVTVTSSKPHRALTLVGEGGKRLLGQAAGTVRIDIAEVRSGCCRLRWTLEARSLISGGIVPSWRNSIIGWIQDDLASCAPLG